MRRLDVAAEADRPVVDAEERDHRRTATLRTVGGERLYPGARAGERVGEDLAGDLRPLSAAPVNPDLEHAGTLTGARSRHGDAPQRPTLRVALQAHHVHEAGASFS